MNKTRFQKSWSTRNVPEDVWPEVLSRLSVKSLLRFRCVSRSWRALIDAPDFARLNLTRFKNNRLQSHLLFVKGKWDTKECDIRCSKAFRITARLGFLQSDLKSTDPLRSSPGRGSDLRSWAVVSSIDGLFMLSNYEIFTGTPELLLWNPSIRKTLILPPTPEVSKKMICLEFGMGFDPLLKDYKYATLIENDTGGVHLVAVYTLGTNSWKTVEFEGEGCSGWRQQFLFVHGSRSFCLRGILYALAKDHHLSPLRLLSFNLSSEVFSSAKLPHSPSHSQDLTMMNDGCSLALFDWLKPEGSIWVMENLTADFKSLIWTKLYTFSMTIPQDETLRGSCKLLYLNRDCEMLLQWRYINCCSSRVSSYNLETGKAKIIMKSVVLDGLTSNSIQPYIESLVLH